MYNKIPDSIVTISFIPTGLCLGHLFFLPWIHRTLYDEFHVWPYFTLLFAIVTTASIISIIKLSNGKYIFEHFIYLSAASVLFIISGVLFIVFNIENTEIGLFLTVIASGITIIAGLSYVNIRTIKHERPMRIAICHMWKLFGFSGTFTIYLFLFYNLDETSNVDEKLREFYQIYGYSIIGSTAIFLLFLMVNEVFQRQGLLYNYRDCLDNDNNIANNYCKLFSKNEVTIERNTTMTTAGMWKSAENLNSGTKQNSCFNALWTIYVLIGKLHGAILFNYFLMTYSMNSAFATFTNVDYVHGMGLWLMIAEAFIGCLFMRFVHSVKVYVGTSIVAVIAIGVSIIFYGEIPPTGVAICLWIFYAAMAISISVPDIVLLEMSKIRFNEIILAAGYFVEIITIASLQQWHNDAHIRTNLLEYTDDFFIPFVIASIVVLIVTSIIYILHVPNTFGKSLLQIQNELLKHQSYFAFIPNEKQEQVIIERREESRNHSQMTDVHESSIEPRSRLESTTRSSIYAELQSTDPLPIVNQAKLFDPYSEITKPPAIIPRATLIKAHPSYENI
ncbi:uncharacterized protein [Chironomus tepperi]|uniref:uncharacterized protein n=1 Tax=Chironomus tepperi TaxID=113505 RepID=UPI00391F10D5